MEFRARGSEVRDLRPEVRGPRLNYLKMRPLKNFRFCSRSRKAMILTTPEEYASHSTGQADIH